MPRKDPLNERGPAPPGGRNQKSNPRNKPVDLVTLRPLHEYERVWDAALANLESAIGQVGLLSNIGVPGLRLEELDEFCRRLNTIKEIEANK